MKTKAALLIMFFSLFPLFAQENNFVQQSNNWFVGLNFSVLTFNQQIKNNFMTLSLERKLNKQFSISIYGGIGSFGTKSPSYSNITRNNEISMIETVADRYDHHTSLSLNIAVKYSPFEWAISPYLIAGYGSEYNFSTDSFTNRRVDTYDKNGMLINSSEKSSVESTVAGFRNGFKFGIGASTKIMGNFYLDGNIIFSGYNATSGSVGVKFGF